MRYYHEGKLIGHATNSWRMADDIGRCVRTMCIDRNSPVGVTARDKDGPIPNIGEPLVMVSGIVTPIRNKRGSHIGSFLYVEELPEGFGGRYSLPYAYEDEEEAWAALEHYGKIQREKALTTQ